MVPVSPRAVFWVRNRCLASNPNLVVTPHVVRSCLALLKRVETYVNAFQKIGLCPCNQFAFRDHDFEICNWNEDDDHDAAKD
jgi:hypothetical protein